MPSVPDLGAYFERIRWSTSAPPTFDTLAGLLRGHMRHIPFENIDVLLGRGVRLDLETLETKLVRSRRGGYCFEHATLFAAVLDALGFAPVRHSARVVLVASRNESPRTHMFLTVELPEGRFVVDPGFGSLASEVPIPLADRVDASTAPAHWLSRIDDCWMLRARNEGKIVDCWVSTLEMDNPIDFVVANHYVATHPDSPFVNRLMLRALTDRGRVSAMNRDVTVREDGASRTFQLADRRALRDLLAESFGFDLPEVEGLRIPSVAEWR